VLTRRSKNSQLPSSGSCGCREALLSKLYTKFGLAVLLLALAVLLASCGGTSGGSKQAAATKDEPTGKEKTPRSAEATGGMDDMGGMDHGSKDMASGMLMKNGRNPSTRRLSTR
jgi:hypothetical protein